MISVKYLISAITLSSCLYVIVRYVFMINSFVYEWDTTTINVTSSKIFDVYLKKFNKSYDDDEYQMRLLNFRNSMREISFLNAVSGARHGWTQFADMSKEEFAKIMLKSRSFQNCTPMKAACVPNVNTTVIPNDIKDKIDWRENHTVGPIIDQLKCACCWAVSIVGTMESMSVITGFEYQQLSIQELITCSTYTAGCSGGSMRALEYLCDNKLALTTEEQYPLQLVSGDKCNSDLYQGIRRLKEFEVKCDMNEDDILRTLAHYGPVVVVVNSGPLMYYNGGVVQRACHRFHDGSSIDHMVQIVGYDLTAPVPYYIVKNSFGVLYGEGGYMRLAVGKNMCGLADEVAMLDVY